MIDEVDKELKGTEKIAKIIFATAIVAILIIVLLLVCSG